MKLKLLTVFCAVTLLAGCNALDGKCDYIPPDNCNCSNLSYESSYYNCNCRQYKAMQQRTDLYHCGPCSCKGDTCNNCWNCGTNYNFHDI